MIYLDNAATTRQKPQAVIDAVVTAMTTRATPPVVPTRVPWRLPEPFTMLAVKLPVFLVVPVRIMWYSPVTPLRLLILPSPAP